MKSILGRLIVGFSILLFPLSCNVYASELVSSPTDLWSQETNYLNEAETEEKDVEGVSAESNNTTESNDTVEEGTPEGEEKETNEFEIIKYEGELNNAKFEYNGELRTIVQSYDNETKTNWIGVYDYFNIIGAEVSESEFELKITLPDSEKIFISKVSPEANVFGEVKPLSTQIQYADNGGTEMLPMLPIRELLNLTNISNLTIGWDESTHTVTAQTLEYRKAQTLPYYIKMYKAQKKMLIYGLDDNLDYTVLVKEYPAIPGKSTSQTPLGKFKINTKEVWHPWGNNIYSKYSMNYAKGLYIHSPLYNGKNDNSMLTHTADLQNNYTAGCLKTYTENCGWIFDNCPVNTVIEIFK